MLIKFLDDCDFVNYKKPSMFIGFPKCSFKCGKEHCQNAKLEQEDLFNIDVTDVIHRYTTNDFTCAVVLGGLEPFDSWDDVVQFIEFFRIASTDDVVIYTGYTEDEIEDKIPFLKAYNVIVKFGRYVPNQEPHFDEILGVYLASDNQYSKKFS